MFYIWYTNSSRHIEEKKRFILLYFDFIIKLHICPKSAELSIYPYFTLMQMHDKCVQISFSINCSIYFSIIVWEVLFLLHDVARCSISLWILTVQEYDFKEITMVSYKDTEGIHTGNELNKPIVRDVKKIFMVQIDMLRSSPYIPHENRLHHSAHHLHACNHLCISAIRLQCRCADI